MYLSVHWLLFIRVNSAQSISIIPRIKPRVLKQLRSDVRLHFVKQFRVKSECFKILTSSQNILDSFHAHDFNIVILSGCSKNIA